ncbi:hypothetical protein APHAL10511_006432 [Amanita phalloides]|nr:hypothetical protein APHAL10511_006432 [Amanita phalloides]
MNSPTWSRPDIAARILAGDLLIIYSGHLLRIPDSWLDAHPGGALPILHLVGRDATDEIQAFHLDHTLDLISRYSIGSIDVSVPWLPLIPPLMAGWVRVKDNSGSSVWLNQAQPLSQGLLVQNNTSLPALRAPDIHSIQPPTSDLSLDIQANHSAAYRQLHKRIVDAGLYNTPYLSGYGPDIFRYTLLATLSAYAYANHWFITSAFFLGLVWHQLVFAAHDLGHMGVTHNWTIDRLLGILIADFIGGLSIGWWVDNHNIHHVVTNHPSHDPDIEHLPFFAISPAFVSSLWSSYYKRVMPFDRFAEYVITVQHKLFYIVMLFARFNLYRLSYFFLIKKAFDTKRARGGRWAWGLEVIALIFFWTWFGRVLYGCGNWQTALAYLLVSHAVTSPLHVQIVLSHFSMSSVDLGPLESFPHRQLRTTSDVICPSYLGFIHGGLHLQVTHHFFPRLPRHNLARASMLVKEYAREQGLTYAEFGFINGNKEVLGVLQQVADQVKLLSKVASAEAQEALDKKLAVSEKSWKANH